MRVRVSTRRRGGRLLRWNELPAVSEGLLLSTRKGVEDRMVVAIFVSGGPAESPSLYEPRLVSSFGSELRFIGLERADGAWVLQEWNCEILSLAPP